MTPLATLLNCFALAALLSPSECFQTTSNSSRGWSRRPSVSMNLNNYKHPQPSSTISFRIPKFVPSDGNPFETGEDSVRDAERLQKFIPANVNRDNSQPQNNFMMNYKHDLPIPSFPQNSNGQN